MEPYFKDEHVTIYHCDCLGFLQQMEQDSVCITVTSPPYNMGITPGGNGKGMYKHATQKAKRFGLGYSSIGDDSLPLDEYNNIRRLELKEMFRVSRMCVFWNNRPRIIHGSLQDPLSGDYGIPLRQRIILARPTGIDVNLNNFCTRGEYLLLFAKPGFKLANHSYSGFGDVWNVCIERHDEHPAVFSKEIPARCIKATGANIVLDPFAGTGTTGRAAKDMGKQAVLIEREERYCEIAAKRMCQQVLDLSA